MGPLARLGEESASEKRRPSISISNALGVICLIGTFIALVNHSSATIHSCIQAIVISLTFIGWLLGFCMSIHFLRKSQKPLDAEQPSPRIMGIHVCTWCFGIVLAISLISLNIVALYSLGQGSFPFSKPHSGSDGFVAFFGYPFRFLGKMGDTQSVYIWDTDLLDRANLQFALFNLLYIFIVTFGASYSIEKLQRQSAVSRQFAVTVLNASILLLGWVFVLRMWAEYNLDEPPVFFCQSLALLSLPWVWPAVMDTIEHVLENKTRSEIKKRDTVTDDDEYSIDRIFENEPREKLDDKE